jgi:hypothetical protein
MNLTNIQYLLGKKANCKLVLGRLREKTGIFYLIVTMTKKFQKMTAIMKVKATKGIPNKERLLITRIVDIRLSRSSFRNEFAFS